MCWLIDSPGTEVVKYTYDAWGKVLSTTGSLASTLGTVQPFRYRGYVYEHMSQQKRFVWALILSTVLDTFLLWVIAGKRLCDMTGQ